MLSRNVFTEDFLKKELKIKSVEEIAFEQGFSESIVYKYVRKFKLQKKPLYQNKEWLANEIKTKSVPQIAEENNLSQRSLRRWVTKFGLEMPNHFDQPYRHKEWLIEMLKKNNNSIVLISNQTGYKPDTLREWCHKFGLTPERRKQELSVNEQYFKEIDTPAKAYYLGFLMADGWIMSDFHSWGIGLQEQDKYILERLAKEINFLGEIKNAQQSEAKFIPQHNPNAQYPVLVVKSTNMCKDLILHGIVPKKTGKETLPRDLDKNLIRHFIRGFIDGDGWVIWNKHKKFNVGVCSSSMNILLSIKEYLEETFPEMTDYKIISKIKESSSVKVYYYNLYGEHADKVLQHLYADTDLYLDRKYQKYLEYLNYRSPKMETSFE